MEETFENLCELEREREQQKLEQQTVKFDPSRHVCNECGKKFDPADMHHLIISPETGATPFYLCHKCGFKRDFPDEYRQEFPDEDEDDEPTPAPESESESDNDDEATATYWLKTVADWTAADRSNKSEMNAQTMNTPQEQRTYFKEIAEMLADEKITTEHACSLIEDLRDAGITAEVMYSHHEQEKGFKEIAELLADRKITTEEACGLFTEWITEWSGWLL
jgi:predicted  nucleic acid-binding Zn-ribbon protein